MKIGYARVSTLDQNLDLQLDTLKQFGCEQIFEEKISGASKERPQLIKLFSILRKGDSVVVWKLDRLGRSLRDLIDLISKMKDLGVTFVSIQDSIDTSTATGRFTFNIFASLAEFEREIISERTRAGLAAARARGRKGGRPPGYSKEIISKIKAVKVLYDQRDNVSFPKSGPFKSIILDQAQRGRLKESLTLKWKYEEVKFYGESDRKSDQRT